MALQIEGGTSGVKADVDANNQIKVALPTLPARAGYAALLARSDAGDFTGSSYDVNPEADEDYRLRVGVDSMRFRHTFDGAALDSGQWQSTVSTMATAVAGGYVTLNSGSSVATSVHARISSYQTFSFSQAFSTYLDIPFMLVGSAAGITNTGWEVGFGIASGTSTPTDGVYLKMNTAGELRLVTSFNGTETTSAAINLGTLLDDDLPLLEPSTDRQFVLEVSSHNVRFWCNGILIATLNQPAGVPTFGLSQSLPIMFRIYNGGSAPSSATQIKIGTVTVTEGGRVNTPNFAEAAAMSGAGAYQGQAGGTMGQTLNWTNSAEPANATLSNTAAGYTTLGGQWAFAAPAGAATDFALFAYTVPAMAAGSHNRNLLIRRIRIDAVNTGAAVATTATVLQWACAVGTTAVSLATTEAATARAPRRIALGMQAFVVGAAIGAQAQTIDVDFSSAPLLAEPGTVVHIIVRVPIGTATASQVIRGTVTITGQHV